MAKYCYKIATDIQYCFKTKKLSAPRLRDSSVLDHLFGGDRSNQCANCCDIPIGPRHFATALNFQRREHAKVQH
jgi:hypothetical protein